MLPDESAYLNLCSPDIPNAAYSPLFGTMMIGRAFNIAAAALMLKKQTHYATPVQDNPHGLRLLTETRHACIESIRSIGYNCYGDMAYVYLAKL